MAVYMRLQSIMDEKGLSVAETARLSGLPDGTVRSIIVRKQNTVALEVAFKLSKGLNVSLEFLNGETDDPTPKRLDSGEETMGAADFGKNLFAAHGDIAPEDYDQDDLDDIAMFMKMIRKRKNDGT